MYNKDPDKLRKVYEDRAAQLRKGPERRTPKSAPRPAAPAPRPAAARPKAPRRKKPKGCAAAMVGILASTLVAAVILIFIKKDLSRHQEQTAAQDIINEARSQQPARQKVEVQRQRPQTPKAVSRTERPAPTPASKPAFNPDIPAQAALALSGEKTVAARAVRKLASYHDEKAAFDAVIKALETHPDRYVKTQALSALSSFKTFNPHPVCVPIIKSAGDDTDMAKRALHTIAGIKYYGYEDILINAMAHPQPKVRLTAINLIGRHGLKPAKEKLRRSAEDDTDEAVRAAALQALVSMHAAEAFPLLKADLAGSDPKQRRAAVRHLKTWRAHPDVLDILAAYKNDPLLGKDITTHLARYGR